MKRTKREFVFKSWCLILLICAIVCIRIWKCYDVRFLYKYLLFKLVAQSELFVPCIKSEFESALPFSFVALEPWPSDVCGKFR